MGTANICLLLLALLLFTERALAFVPGLYCGLENCYEVLGVTSDTTKSELAKAYRKLAKQYHPDRVRGEEEKKVAEERFRLIATAYETLKDDDERSNYDYMLAHPEERMYHYYQYYRRRVAPKVDPRIVIAVTILVISIIQYMSAYHKYKEAIDYLITQPKYRLRAHDIAVERQLISDNKAKGKKKRDKEDKEEQEAIIRAIIEENIDIKGGYRRASIRDTVACQLVLLPITLFHYCHWWLRWTWRFTIRREEYDEPAKLHLIRKKLKLSENQFACLPDGEHDDFLRKELWIQTKFAAWKTQKEEEEKLKMAQSGRYKQYRRYMKNQGPGQISFLDED